MKTFKSIIQKSTWFRCKMILQAFVVGAAAGACAVLYRILLEKASQLNSFVRGICGGKPLYIGLWFLCLVGMAFLVYRLLKWEPAISGSGIPQTEAEVDGLLNASWIKVIVGKFLAGFLAIGAGLSLGREGPSIQLGSMTGKGIAAFGEKSEEERKLMLTCGASAGLAAAFNAPFAGMLFALEEVHKNFSAEVLLTSLSAAVTADILSKSVFGMQPVFTFPAAPILPLRNYWLVLLLGIFAGLSGVIYTGLMKKTHAAYAKIKSPFIRVCIPFLLAGVLAFTLPQVLGGGHHLIEEIAQQNTVLWFVCLLFVVKFIFSMISFCSGTPGGIFLPLLVLGALVGTIFFGGAEKLMHLDPQLLVTFIILGMVGHFSAIVRAPVTGVILISEMTGSFSHLLSLSVVAVTAYMVAELLRSKPVYEYLLDRLVPKKRSDRP